MRNTRQARWSFVRPILCLLPVLLALCSLLAVGGTNAKYVLGETASLSVTIESDWEKVYEVGAPYNSSDGKGAFYIHYKGTDAAVNVPAKMYELDVTSIFRMFADNSTIRTVSYENAAQIIDASYAFYCTRTALSGFATGPALPSGTINAMAAYQGRVTMTSVPNLPNQIQNLTQTFKNTGIVTAPGIPASVTMMRETFIYCKSLTTAPTIPSGVTDVAYAFYECTALVTPPSTIPASVTTMAYAFLKCPGLTGSMEIKGNPTMTQCFTDTSTAAGSKLYVAAPSASTRVTGYTVESASNVYIYAITPDSYSSYTVGGVQAYFWYAGSKADVRVPATLAGQNVTNAYKMFCDNDTVRTVSYDNGGQITRAGCMFARSSIATGGFTAGPALPSGTTDASYAYYQRQSMTSVAPLPNDVTIMMQTFMGCSALTVAPIIPNGVRRMVQTFTSCSSLTAAPAIPAGVADMYCTFSECDSLITGPATIPDSVTDMRRTFENCPNLTGSMEIKGNPPMAGCFTGTSTAAGTKLYVAAPSVSTNVTGYTVDSASNVYIYAITPDSYSPYTVGGVKAYFQYAGSKADVRVPDTLAGQSVTDAYKMFNDNDTVRTVSYDNGSQITGADYMFARLSAGTGGFTTGPALPGGTTNARCAYYGRKSMTTAAPLPNGVTDMTQTFDGCSALTVAPIIPNGVRKVLGTFIRCSSLTAAPAIPSSVTNMNQTFDGCSALVKPPETIPASVNEMLRTFYGCSKLTGSMEIKGNPTMAGCFTGTSTAAGTKLYVAAPSASTNVTRYTVDSASNIYIYAITPDSGGPYTMDGAKVYFKYAGSKADVWVPAMLAGQSVTDAHMMFYDNDTVRTVSYDNGSQITGATYMFGRSSAVTGGFTAGPALPSGTIDAAYAYKLRMSMTAVAALPGGVKNLYQTFFWSGLLTAPTIPGSVTSMQQTFEQSNSLTAAPAIPAGVTSLFGTFWDCDSLVTGPATIPASVTDMGRTFERCPKLTGSMEIKGNPSMAACFSGTSTAAGTKLYVAAPSASTYVTRYTVDSASNIYIYAITPDSSSTYTVGGVQAYFQYAGSKADVRVPAMLAGQSVTDAYKMFYDNDTVRTVSYGNGSQITGATFMFARRSAVAGGFTTGPALPSGTINAKHAYYQRKSMTTVAPLPNGVKELRAAFLNTGLLTAPTIPSGVNGMQTTFQQCKSLTVAPAIPAGVTDMDNAFWLCDNLATGPATIPASVTNLNNAFNNCPKLTGSMEIKGNPIMGSCFYGTSTAAGTKLYVATPGASTNVTGYTVDSASNVYIYAITPDDASPYTVGGDWAYFWYAGNKADVRVPATLAGQSVTDAYKMFNDNNTVRTVSYDSGNQITGAANMFARSSSGIGGFTVGPALPSGTIDAEYAYTSRLSMTSAAPLPDNVQSLLGTFTGTGLITAPEIPNGVTNLNSTFLNCRSLTAAPDIPSSVTKMFTTFTNCTALVTPPPTIPSGVTDISMTFSGTPKLTGSMEIKGNPKMDDCFSGTSTAAGTKLYVTAPSASTNVTGCTVDSASNIYIYAITPDSGSPYTVGVAKAYFKYAGSKADVWVPATLAGQSVTNAYYMFFNNDTVRTVSYENGNQITGAKSMFARSSSVTGGFTTGPALPGGTINAQDAYQRRKSMTSVAPLPAGVTNLYCTFISTGLLTAPNIPGGVTDMRQTFDYCDELVTPPKAIPASVTYLTRTFASSPKLTGSMEIKGNPDMGSCFASSSKAAGSKLYVAAPSASTKVTGYSVGSDQNIYIYAITPDSNSTYTVGGVKAYFKYAGSKADVRVPDTLAGQNVTDAYKMFCDNDTVRTVSYDSGSQITGADYMFARSSAATGGFTAGPALPSGTISARYAYHGRQSMTTAAPLPNGVTDLAIAYFGTGLLTAPIIPGSVTNMQETFEQCKSLTVAPAIPAGVTKMIGTFWGCINLTTGPETIPASVTTLEYAFNGCSKLTGSMEIKGNPTMDNCFTGTSTVVGSKLYVAAPSTSTKVTGCTVDSASNVYIYAIVPDASPYTVGGRSAYFWYAGNKADVRVPDTLAGQSVTNIYMMFLDNLTVRTVSYDNGSQITGATYAFYIMSGAGGFTTGPALPSGTIDAEYAYVGRHSMTSVAPLPGNVQELYGTFTDTGLITAPKIPDGVSNLNCTFTDCKSLTAAPDIPSSVTELGSAFSGCTALVTPPPTIPSGVTSMDYTFQDIPNLTGLMAIMGNPTMKDCFTGTSTAAETFLMISTPYTSTNVVNYPIASGQNIVIMTTSSYAVFAAPVLAPVGDGENTPLAGETLNLIPEENADVTTPTPEQLTPGTVEYRNLAVVEDGLEDGRIVDVPQAPEIPGYTFLGWSVDGAEVVEPLNWLVEEDTVFYALYQRSAEAPGETTPPEETAPPEENIPPEDTLPPEETAPPVETEPPAETAPPAESVPPEETAPPAEAPDETKPAEPLPSPEEEPQEQEDKLPADGATVGLNPGAMGLTGLSMALGSIRLVGTGFKKKRR